MTGEQLYELSAMGFRHDPFDQLPKLLQELYNEQASYRCRDHNKEQGESVHTEQHACSGRSTCCGQCTSVSESQ